MAKLMGVGCTIQSFAEKQNQQQILYIKTHYVNIRIYMCAYYIYIYAIYLYNIWNIHSIIQNKDKYFNYVYIYIYTHTHIYTHIHKSSNREILRNWLT